jgi:hypothetical protein
MCGCTGTISSYSGEDTANIFNTTVSMVPKEEVEYSTSSGSKFTNTMDSIMGWATTGANIFQTIKGGATTQPATNYPAPAPQSAVPMAVWIVGGAVLLIVLAFILKKQ